MAEWFADGLRFECTLCGNCCTGAPGYVLFTPAESEAIAKRLRITVERFIEDYTQDMGMDIAGRSRTIREVQTEHGYDCIFLDRTTIPGKAVCSLYEDRPTQCRTFPFWPEHIATARDWNRLGKSCEGVGQGPIIPASAIRIDVEKHRKDRRGATS